MFTVEQPKPSKAFIDAWVAAGRHLQSLGGERLRWVRAHLNPPFAEHLSFLLGNQLVFVYLQAEEYAQGGTLDVFHAMAEMANAIPCLMPMVSGIRGYEPALPGWGLRHSMTGELVNVAARVSDALIPMSDWEVHDAGLHVASESIRALGFAVYARQSDPRIHPQIWYRDGEKACWLIVRTTRHPAPPPLMDNGLWELARGLASQGDRGSYMGVALANANDAFDPEVTVAMPLFRGHGLLSKTTALIEVAAETVQ